MAQEKQLDASDRSSIVSRVEQEIARFSTSNCEVNDTRTWEDGAIVETTIQAEERSIPMNAMSSDGEYILREVGSIIRDSVNEPFRLDVLIQSVTNGKFGAHGSGIIDETYARSPEVIHSDGQQVHGKLYFVVDTSKIEAEEES